MRLLVTRPEIDATGTARRLRDLGHEPVLAPMLVVVLLPPPASVDPPAALLFTSRNGVRAAAQWPQLPGWLDLPVFATGQATAAAAREAGFADVRSGNGDSADLANYLVAYVDKGLRPILYPAARDRAGGLSSGLRANGFDLRTVEAYRADLAPQFPPAIRARLEAREIDGVLFYSMRTAEAFRNLVAKEGLRSAVRQVPFYVLSGRIAEALADLGETIRVAKHPSETELLALLPNARG